MYILSCEFSEVWTGEQVYVFLDEANTVSLQLNFDEHLHTVTA